MLTGETNTVDWIYRGGTDEGKFGQSMADRQTVIVDRDKAKQGRKRHKAEVQCNIQGILDSVLLYCSTPRTTRYKTRHKD